MCEGHASIVRRVVVSMRVVRDAETGEFRAAPPEGEDLDDEDEEDADQRDGKGVRLQIGHDKKTERNVRMRRM